MSGWSAPRPGSGRRQGDRLSDAGASSSLDLDPDPPCPLPHEPRGAMASPRREGSSWPVALGSLARVPTRPAERQERRLAGRDTSEPPPPIQRLSGARRRQLLTVGARPWSRPSRMVLQDRNRPPPRGGRWWAFPRVAFVSSRGIRAISSGPEFPGGVSAAPLEIMLWKKLVKLGPRRPPKYD